MVLDVAKIEFCLLKLTLVTAEVECIEDLNYLNSNYLLISQTLTIPSLKPAAINSLVLLKLSEFTGIFY